MWVLLGDTSHLFPSVTDSFLVVTLKGPDIQSGWAFITGFLLLSCSGGKPAWFHPSEAFRHALHCCISVLSALKKRDYMIHLVLLPLFIYHWRSPCGVCPHITKTNFRCQHQTQNWPQRSREYVGTTANFGANPVLSIPCPVLKGQRLSTCYKR